MTTTAAIVRTKRTVTRVLTTNFNAMTNNASTRVGVVTVTATAAIIQTKIAGAKSSPTTTTFYALTGFASIGPIVAMVAMTAVTSRTSGDARGHRDRSPFQPLHPMVVAMSTINFSVVMVDAL